jgi:hypothetical protein
VPMTSHLVVGALIVPHFVLQNSRPQASSTPRFRPCWPGAACLSSLMRMARYRYGWAAIMRQNIC